MLVKEKACARGIEDFVWQYGESVELEWTLEEQLQFIRGPLRKYFSWAMRHEIIRAWSMRGVDLQGVDLSGVTLWEVDLRDADLSGTDLSGANLQGTDLSGVNLSGADLTETKGRTVRGKK